MRKNLDGTLALPNGATTHFHSFDKNAKPFGGILEDGFSPEHLGDSLLEQVVALKSLVGRYGKSPSLKLLFSFPRNGKLFTSKREFASWMSYCFLQPIAIRQRLDVVLHPLPIRLTIWCGRELNLRIVHVVERPFTTV